VCRIKFGVEAQAVSHMTPIEHGFTHFSLTIAPLLCRVRQRPSQVQLPGLVWVRPDDAMLYAIPVPVRKLVSQLRTRFGQPQARPVQAG